MADRGSDMQIISSNHVVEIPNIDDIPGYIISREYDINKLFSKLTGQKCQLSIGRPAVNGPLIAVGSCRDPYVIVLDPSPLLAGKRPIIHSYALMPAEVHDVKWLSSNALICGFGNGRIQIFNSNKGILSSIGELNNLHTAAIREIATNTNCAAIGGDDNTLTISDFDRMELNHRISHNDAVGSVRWKNPDIVTITLDRGALISYDLRQPTSVQSLQYQSGKMGLYAHESIGNATLLGYSDGEIHIIDDRMQSCTRRILDPKVKPIGNIECYKNAFVTSGRGNICVWTTSFSVWSHGVVSPPSLQMNTNASFYTDDIVVVGNSEGKVALYEQGFS